DETLRAPSPGAAADIGQLRVRPLRVSQVCGSVSGAKAQAHLQEAKPRPLSLGRHSDGLPARTLSDVRPGGGVMPLRRRTRIPQRQLDTAATAAHRGFLSRT